MTNGWPDPARPGVPLNPERDKWHWLRNRYGANVPALWVAQDGYWRLNGQDYAAKSAARNQQYLGPCLTPAEVAALVAEARREERDACAAIADAGAPTKHWQDYHSQEAALRAEGQEAASEHIAAAIRARGAA